MDSEHKAYIYEYKETDNAIFFSATVNWVFPSDVQISERFGKWYLYCSECYYYSKYGIFVKINDDIYTIEEALENGLVTDLSCIEEFSEIAKVYRVGDVDLDKEVSILDATLIQMKNAQLVRLEYIQNKIADVDNDSEITILDATAIQKILAKK